MMWDRIFEFFSGRHPVAHADCTEPDVDVDKKKARKRRELERREQEARRMNDALEDLANNMRRRE